MRPGLALPTGPRLQLGDTGGEARPGLEAAGALHIEVPSRGHIPVSNWLLNVHGSAAEEEKVLLTGVPRLSCVSEPELSLCMGDAWSWAPGPGLATLSLTASMVCPITWSQCLMESGAEEFLVTFW